MCEKIITEKINLFELLTENEFVIPFFQRKYSWTKENCEAIWEDINTIIKEPIREDINTIIKNDTHFFGNITLAKISKNKYYVVDGQQRLTTLSLFVSALSEDYKKLLLINNNPKLRFEDPIDQRTYRHIIKNCFCEQESLSVNMKNNSDYFKSKIEKTNIRDIKSLLEKLLFVKVVLTDKMAPQRIFERINGCKIKVTDMELIKNFLLMEAGCEKEKEVFDFWNKEMQNNKWRFETIIKMYFKKNNIHLYKDFKKFYCKQKPKEALEFLRKINEIFSDFNSLYEQIEKKYSFMRPYHFAPFIMLITLTKIEKDEKLEILRNLFNSKIWWIIQDRLWHKRMHPSSWETKDCFEKIENLIKKDIDIKNNSLDKISEIIQDKKDFYNIITTNINDDNIRNAISNWLENNSKQSYVANKIGLGEIINKNSEINTIINEIKEKYPVIK